MERSDVGTTNAHPPQLKHPRAPDIVEDYGFVVLLIFFDGDNDERLAQIWR